MIRGSVCGVAAAIALLAITPCLADAATMQCPGAIPAGNSVGDGSGIANTITAVSALSAVGPDGKAAFSPFGYLYATRGAGAYVEDGFPHGWIVAATGTAPSDVRAAYAKLRDDVPPSKLSQGAAMILNPAWTLAIVPCAQPA
jgi:hypothetical protein